MRNSVMPCPSCGSDELVSRYGFSHSIQRYRCRACNRTYMDGGDGRAYSAADKERAFGLLNQGWSIRAVAREMGTSLSTVSRWCKAARESGEEARPSVRRSQSAVAPVAAPVVAPVASRLNVPVGKMTHEEAMAMLVKGGIISPSAPVGKMTSAQALARLEAGGEVSVADLMRD